MAQHSDLRHLIPQLAGRRVLIIGDVMLDRFVSCGMERVSPEAPVPILRHQSERNMLGGAGNVAANISALGATPFLLGVIGDDTEGEIVRRICHDTQIEDRWLVASMARVTSLKTRFVAKGQQVVRYDREEAGAIDDAARAALEAAFDAAVGEADIVVLSDYAKGTLAGGLAEVLIDRTRRLGLQVVVDPKGRDYGRYRGASVIKPNLKELCEATGISGSQEGELIEASESLVQRLELDALVVSRGAQGISVITGGRAVHIPTIAREVFDEAGAGDTVVGVLALGLAAGFELETASRLANAAAGVVVGKRGTAQVSPAELHHALRGSEQGSVVTRAAAGPLIETWRSHGQKIGFTNGCFDILHTGHIALLEQAKEWCDRLIVGLNSDDSVRRLKGPTRPINQAAQRARLLAALAVVDLVVIFEEDAPAALIEAFAPDVLVKGADYALEDVVGGDFVRARGGSVKLARLVPGVSTTTLVRAIEAGGGAEHRSGPRD